jgi:hypothetical protein
VRQFDRKQQLALLYAPSDTGAMELLNSDERPDIPLWHGGWCKVSGTIELATDYPSHHVIVMHPKIELSRGKLQ